MASGSPARLAFRSHSATSNAAIAWVARPLRPTEAPAQQSLTHSLPMSLGSSPIKHVGDLLGVGELAGAAGPLGVAEADALVAVARCVTSTKRNATSVIGFCRPVSTLASLIGVASGSVMLESLKMGDPVHCGGAVGRHVGSFLSEVWASDS